jgi:hypothetical protein
MSVYKVTGVQESDGEVFKTLPPGVYPAQITECKFVDINKEGSEFKGATMLCYTVKAMGEEFSSNARGTIILPYEKAMDAEQMRKSIAKIKRLQVACGLPASDDIDDEAFLHCELRVKLSEKDDPKYGKQNEVVDVMSM